MDTGSIKEETEIENALETLTVEEGKINDAIAKEEQEIVDTASYILNKNSVSQSEHAKKRRR